MDFFFYFSFVCFFILGSVPTFYFQDPLVFVSHLLASSSHVIAVVLLWSLVSLCLLVTVFVKCWRFSAQQPSDKAFVSTKRKPKGVTYLGERLAQTCWRGFAWKCPTERVVSALSKPRRLPMRKIFSSTCFWANWWLILSGEATSAIEAGLTVQNRNQWSRKEGKKTYLINTTPISPSVRAVLLQAPFIIQCLKLLNLINFPLAELMLNSFAILKNIWLSFLIN